MRRFLLFFYLVINIYKSTNNTYNHSNNENNLYFVLTLFRHGARKTLVKRDYFNNKIKNVGKLTNYGAKQHLIIGKKYRKRYFNFLNLKNKSFNKDQIYVRSSDIKRALLSTKKQLEGLFNSTLFEKYIDLVDIRKDPMTLYYLILLYLILDIKRYRKKNYIRNFSLYFEF